MTFGERAHGRDNHFNLIRVCAAGGVLVSHAWPISLGPDAVQPLSPWIGMTLGHVCVWIFFAVSGFFIARSFDQGGALFRFASARALRIFPGLLVVLLLTIAAAAFFTSAPAMTFWAATPGYLLRNLTLAYPLYPLPGLFEANPYPGAINGSLWTLIHEVLCYVGVAAAGLLGLLRPGPKAALGFAAAIGLLLGAPYAPLPPRVIAFAALALPFALGSAIYVWRNQAPLSPWIAAALLTLAALANGTALFPPLFALALTYATLAAGFSRVRAPLAYNRIGDVSYGLYIYAFPVQQAVAAFGVIDPLTNIALSVPVTLVLAALSWRLIEKPALEFKPGRRAEAQVRSPA